jgi:(1->4)-alpha-D-glucan 1-alpha-D-glucosylmutase
LADLGALYRLQLTSAFGFDEARALVPYLRGLGVSHLYLSPSLEARAGSLHGYDVIDPARVSDERGGLVGLRKLSAAVHEAGMGIVLDVVPNHMAAVDENRLWSDPALRERFFDVDSVTRRHRRFFVIDDLAGVRVEDPLVFEETHELVLRLVGEGVIDGLRIDHPDGLADPSGYLDSLRGAGVERLWVEKILGSEERLPDWPVCGTVGYEFLCDACGLFVDPAGEAPLTALWEEVSGDRRGFFDVALASKLEQVRGPFAPEVERLSHEWGGSGGSELPLAELEEALAALPVYRTYVEPWAGHVTDADRCAVDAAGMAPRIGRALLLEGEAPTGFVTRFQQTTPGVTAKGVEDTAFYRYARLLALNDVGGDPGRFGISVEQFHGACAERALRWPSSLLTTTTHDTKRSGDVRARIGALSSVADEWADVVGRLMAATEPLRTGGAPDDVERYFIFQTLAGAWPIARERLSDYMIKATRERAVTTRWAEPNSDWEDAVARFCHALYTDDGFLSEFEPFADRLAQLGNRAALGQLALKLTVPGVPDIYQGDELWYRALVDPDNRRPVDFARRAHLLRAREFADEPKLWLTSELLALRARRPEAFAGRYDPVDAGEDAIAFARGGAVLVVISLRGGSASVASPSGRWRDVIAAGEHGVTVLERVGR